MPSERERIDSRESKKGELDRLMHDAKRLFAVVAIEYALVASILTYTLRPVSWISNWGGYVLASPYLNRDITGVSSIIRVPYGKAEKSLRFEFTNKVQWIGIGGAYEKNLVQEGIYVKKFPGINIISYGTWYEIYPKMPMIDTSMQVKPGDEIYARIERAGREGDSWLFYMRDMTNGEYFRKVMKCSMKGNSADWVVENPEYLFGLVHLTPTTETSFENAYVYFGNMKEPISRVPAVSTELEYYLSGKKEILKIYPSIVNPKRNSFILQKSIVPNK
jgi:hypothetical protein